LTPDLDGAISAAVDHALIHNMATVISRGGLELLTVVPDTVLLELIANGTALNGGTVMHRPDGRSVRVVHL
jgi:hypothetical protein